LLAALGVILCPQVAAASGRIERYLLAAGADSGGPTRVPLQYAVSDAERFAEVMVKMGGVDPANHEVLRQPDLERFEKALEDLQTRVSTSQSEAGRTQVLLFYSGHADEEGLLLGSEHLSYSALREKMDAIEADVRITVLDACASGAITRIKGGQRRQAFLVDASSDMQGYAFLTSSSEDEAAQESDLIGASFFTHYLVSGMRGAADVSGEGKVTLSEAYQFAFHETLARTTETQGGAQHPAYHINLSGTGDVVMTDIRVTSAGLVLTEDLQGRFFVRNSDEQLVAELYKPAGRGVELGLEPGTYKIHLEQEPALFVATVNVEEGARLALLEGHFQPTERSMTVMRGSRRTDPASSPGSFGGLARRSRLEFRVGGLSPSPKSENTESGLVTTQAGSWGLLIGLGDSRWIQESLSVGIDVSVLGTEVTSTVGPGVSAQVLSLVSIVPTLKKYFPTSTLHSPIRPYLAGGVGTYIGSVEETTVGFQVATRAETMGALVVQVGAGIDFQLGRHLMLGLQGAVNLATDFREPLGGRKNYSGFEYTVGVSWLFGKGLQPRN
jgi:hypothetical protein